MNYLIRGWVNYFRIASMKSKITEIDEHLRVRIRVIIWKQYNFTVIRNEALGKFDENKGRFKINKDKIKLSKKQKVNNENNK